MKNIIAVVTGLVAAMCLTSTLSFAETNQSSGQSIQITANLHSFVGKPTWLLMIHDLDHDINIPYLYDFTQNVNSWMAFTNGSNYVITSSEMTFPPSERKIRNFCNLESRGSTHHKVSMQVTITGVLSPRTDKFTCKVLKYADANFTIATPNS
jgi:hypothetical protein